MATVEALTGKVKFVNTGKTEYRVETLLNGSKSRWKQTFSTYEDAMKYIEDESDIGGFLGREYLVTEVFTRTLGVF